MSANQTVTQVVQGIRVARVDAVALLGPNSLPAPARWVGQTLVPSTGVAVVDAVIVSLRPGPLGDYIATAVVDHPIVPGRASEAIAKDEYVISVTTTNPQGLVTTRYAPLSADPTATIVGRATMAAAPGALVPIALYGRPPERELVQSSIVAAVATATLTDVPAVGNRALVQVSAPVTTLLPDGDYLVRAYLGDSTLSSTAWANMAIGLHPGLLIDSGDLQSTSRYTQAAGAGHQGTSSAADTLYAVLSVMFDGTPTSVSGTVQVLFEVVPVSIPA